jgi:hypothetical protein
VFNFVCSGCPKLGGIPEFYDLLWLMFEYEYGLNMRNALMHGEGLIYTSKYYVYLVFFVFLYLFISFVVYPSICADAARGLLKCYKR